MHNLVYKCPDGRRTHSFKDFFYESLLSESPNRVNYSTNMDNYSYNVEETKDIVKMYSCVGSILVGGVEISIYSREENTEVDYYLISDIVGDLLTVSRSTIKNIGSNIWQIKLAWNKKSEGKTVYRNFFKKYLIEKYSYIISNNNITKDAQFFWEDIITHYTEAYPDERDIFVYNTHTRKWKLINHIDDLKEAQMGLDVWDDVNWAIGIKTK